jgi:hypothetical protein
MRQKQVEKGRIWVSSTEQEKDGNKGVIYLEV